jgi:AGCS family alanine or glycine:cation symporter
LSGNNKTVELIFRLVFVAVAFVGAVSTSADGRANTAVLNLIWDIADTLNGLMAIPNLIALILLSGTVIGLTRDYFESGGGRKRDDVFIRGKRRFGRQ